MRRIQIRARAIGIAAIVASIGCAASAPAPASPPHEQTVPEAIYEELQPVALKNCTLKRFGSRNDGGYLMCENLVDGVRSAYSYGIDTEDNWGCDVSREYKVPVHQYDCFTEHRPTCDGGTFVFHDECVGPKAETIKGQPFDSVTNQIAKNGDAGKPLLVKMDVEGAEWDSLMATPDEVLDRFVQLPMELHGTSERRFVETIRKLKKTFYVVNLHFNNWACTTAAPPLLSTAYQVLLVNKRYAVVDEKATKPAPSSPLNAPDARERPECQPAPLEK